MKEFFFSPINPCNNKHPMNFISDYLGYLYKRLTIKDKYFMLKETYWTIINTKHFPPPTPFKITSQGPSELRSTNFSNDLCDGGKKKIQNNS